MIKKAGALVFEEKKLLIVKPKNKPFYINPGGKYEGDETILECLARELDEELKVNVRSFRVFGTYEINKAAHADDSLCLDLFIVKINGMVTPSSEIEKADWLSRQDYENRVYNLAPSFDKFIPDLIKQGYL